MTDNSTGVKQTAYNVALRVVWVNEMLLIKKLITLNIINAYLLKLNHSQNSKQVSIIRV